MSNLAPLKAGCGCVLPLDLDVTKLLLPPGLLGGGGMTIFCLVVTGGRISIFVPLHMVRLF